MNSPTQLIKHIRDSLFDGKNKGSMFSCYLPSEVEIDDIPVFLKIHYNNISHNCYLIIHNPSIMVDFCCNEHMNGDYNLLFDPCLCNIELIPNTLDKCEHIINSLRELLPPLKFNRMIGKFVNDSYVDHTHLRLELVDMFKDCSTITVNPRRPTESCCVCLEETETRSACKHHICIPCALKIEASPIHIDDEDEEEGVHLVEMEVLCPVCRKELTF
jgi:hypothetical protein